MPRRCKCLDLLSVLDREGCSGIQIGIVVFLVAQEIFPVRDSSQYVSLRFLATDNKVADSLVEEGWKG